MKKILAFLCMAAAMAACSNTETVEKDEAVISFHPLMERTTPGTSRGTVMGTDLTNFQCYVYGTVDAEGGQEAELYLNRLTLSNVSGTWSLGGTYYWPPRGMHFYAFAPLVASTGGSEGVTAENVTATAHTLTYRVPASPAQQHDLVWATAATRRTISPVVDLRFAHALSQVVFYGKVVQENLSVQVSSIEVCNLRNGGTLDLSTPSTANPWTLATTTASYSLASMRTTAMRLGDTGDHATVTGGSNDSWCLTTNNPLLIMPQVLTPWAPVAGTAPTTTSQHYVHIKGRIWYTSNNYYLVGSASADGDFYAPLTFTGAGITDDTFEPGKKYELVINFGAGYKPDGNKNIGGEITFTPSIASAWTAVSGTVDM